MTKIGLYDIANSTTPESNRNLLEMRERRYAMIHLTFKLKFRAHCDI